MLVAQRQVYHFRNAFSGTHIRYRTLVGVKFLSDAKTKENKKVKLLFLKEPNKNKTSWSKLQSSIFGLGSARTDRCRNTL